MNSETFMRAPRVRALALAVLALGAAPSFAAEVTVNLAAVAAGWTAPDGLTTVPMWDFATDAGSCPLATDPVAAWDPMDPPIRAADGDTLVVNVRNCLAEPVSFFVPGLRGTATGGTAGRFTAEIAAGGTGSYTIALRPGTFLYHSATDRIRTQVPMGLYGALVVDSAAAADPTPASAYPGVTYDQDEVLVFSAIDPVVNAGSGGARVTNWSPQYFLINGQAYSAAAVPIAFGTGDNVVLRLVNAGLDTVVPTLDGGLYVNLVAEDGNRYPHPMAQYGVELPAGKTIDAVVQVSNVGKYALYDRALHLTNGMDTGGGMLTYLDVAAGAGLFELSAPAYSVTENGVSLAVTVNRVGGSAGEVSVNFATANGTATTAGNDYTAAAGTLTFVAGDTSETFNVTIGDDSAYEGNETFSVALSNPTGGAKLGTPSSATVTITDNEEAPATLQLDAATYNVAENGGSLTVTVNRVGGSAGAVSVDFATANGTATTAGNDYTAAAGTLTFVAGDTSETFNVAILDDTMYEGNETFSVSLSAATGGATLGTPSSATVTITENDNAAPIANDDTASTARNTGVTINVVINDTDPAGAPINPASVVVTTGALSQFGGTVINNGNGTVTFTPRRGFRGTDTFQYNVKDSGTPPLTSNTATVRVNVQ